MSLWEEDASETVKGHVELATAAETTAGTDNTRAVHPAGLKVELDKKIPKSLLTAAGDIIYASAANTPAILTKGTDGQALVLSGGLPTWGNAGPKYATGSYTGDGSASRTITVGFTPTLAFISANGPTGNSAMAAIVGFSQEHTSIQDSAGANVQVFGNHRTDDTRKTYATTNGFVVRAGSTDGLNQSGVSYSWMAIG